MEGDQNGDQSNIISGSSSGTAGAPPASSRWNPTKEQINMLEGLYRQGIRTPSAEQIKQITSRLKAFGHIEGKNVFYWFQNHKARQRQKQKQENMAYINRFLQRSATQQPIFPPSQHYPYPYVVCGPYYLPVGAQTDHHTGTTFHHQFHPNKIPPSNGTRRISSNGLDVLEKISGAISFEPADHDQEGYYNYNNVNLCNQETLSLFPLSPTGVNTGSCSVNFYAEKPASNESTPSSSSGVEEGCSSAGHDHQPFYDFFSTS